ncbi:hypothetical protein C0J52_17145 [Blattella germanica]|nr:hypothetical protein C0J52_17145 [Blattella germanica]
MPPTSQSPMILIADYHLGHTCTSLIQMGPEQLALPLSVGITQVQYGTVLEWLKIMKPLGGLRPPAINQGHDFNTGWMPTIFGKGNE